MAPPNHWRKTFSNALMKPCKPSTQPLKAQRQSLPLLNSLQPVLAVCPHGFGLLWWWVPALFGPWSVKSFNSVKLASKPFTTSWKT
jgi:hypothetical protein